MAVELNLGGKNYQYTPRHPYREVVVSDEECYFQVESPDGTVLCCIKGETGDAEEKKIRRFQDMTPDEAKILLNFGFFSPNSAEPHRIESEQKDISSEGVLKKMMMIFLKRRMTGNTSTLL